MSDMSELLLEIESGCQQCPICKANLMIDREKGEAYLNHKEDCRLHLHLETKKPQTKEELEEELARSESRLKSMDRCSQAWNYWHRCKVSAEKKLTAMGES